MGNLTQDEIRKLPTQFDTVSYSTFFKVWYALQKAIPHEQKGEFFTKIGRSIGNEFDDEGIETIDAFLEKLQQFLEKEWAITDNAKVDFQKDAEGNVVKLLAKQDSCKMCYANTYYRLHDNGSPSCMFPQVIMGILNKVRRKFGFKNLRFEGVQKGRVGECAMTWNIR
ncbi:MAG: hypothetical protein EAX89_12520 [Candidatus Lokiarchaeota archaeon]|nr:hypothetical protein [Candidatus Lokiarchaeota archaeon]